MEIKFWEHWSSTDERSSTVKGRYLHKEVAEAMAKADSGWYGAADWVGQKTIYISEATTIDEATLEKIKMSADYKKYLELHEKFKDVK